MLVQYYHSYLRRKECKGYWRLITYDLNTERLSSRSSEGNGKFYETQINLLDEKYFCDKISDRSSYRGGRFANRLGLYFECST